MSQYRKSSIVRWGLLFTILMATTAAQAWQAEGYVYCDSNQNGVIDVGDAPIEGVTVRIQNAAGTWFGTPDTTDANGNFMINLQDVPDSYIETLDASTLPADAIILMDVTGEHHFFTSDEADSDLFSWLIDSETCQSGLCWLTGGGVKFEPLVGADLAQHGPKDTLGGNVHPSCSPDPGEGGQWNHVSHSTKQHFQGFVIHTVACGNVPGIPSGSESPVTGFNYIEFQGTGRVKGIHGNKVSYPNVYFFGRAEDHNEPGNDNAADGDDVDEYYLHVFTDLGNPIGSTVLCVDADGDCSDMNPITITGGNLQLHDSSCDN